MKDYEFFTELFSHVIQAENMNFAFQKYGEWADDPDDMDIVAIVELQRGTEFIKAFKEALTNDNQKT